MKHITSTKQFTDRAFVEKLFDSAQELEEAGIRHDLEGKILATLFFEPSTRTRFSFETAMLRLGGQVISAESAAQFSSAKKGETLADTIRTVNGYADAIVLRHPEEGSADQAAAVSEVPILNAGDGAGEHPTQALLDLYTMRKEIGKIDGLQIGLVGDLLYSRTVHSQLPLYPLFKDVTLHLVTPPELRMPKKYTDYLREKKVVFQEYDNLDTILPKLDILYVTRVQQERFASPEAYEKVKSAFIITPETLSLMKPEARVLHPLPRITEIAPEVDADPRAAYFRQAKNGVYIRMALLKMLLCP